MPALPLAIQAMNLSLRHSLVPVALFVVGSLAAQAPARAPKPAPAPAAQVPDGIQIQWFATLDRGLAEARRTGKPILFVSAAPHFAGVSGMW